MKKFTMNRLVKLSPLVLLVAASPALAYDWSGSAHVKIVEGTYAPSQLPFQVDQDLGSCPAGSWLTWNPQGSDATSKAYNYQAIMNILIAARTTGKYVMLFGDNNGCTVDFLHLQ